jgi:hypothetical protein
LRNLKPYLRRSFIAATLLIPIAPQPLAADPIPVRYSQGTIHGFFTLKSTDGSQLAIGEVKQTVKGTRVTTHMTFHFRDGSLDDETATFTQRTNFQLITDHHIQKGPSFPKPVDMTIDVPTGQITSRSPGDDGKEKITQEHNKFPIDLSNGILFSLMMNIRPDTPKQKSPCSVPKSRVVKLSIKPQSEDSFTFAGIQRKAIHYRIKIELGGITGVVAPIVGKQAADIDIWTSSGEVPAFIKEEGQFYEDGPIWSIEQTAPALARTSDTAKH